MKIELNPLEKLVSSIAGMKALKILVAHRNIRMKDFLRQFGGTSGEAYKILKRLEQSGIITNEYKLYGNRKTRTIHLMTQHTSTKALLQVLKILAEANSN